MQCARTYLLDDGHRVLLRRIVLAILAGVSAANGSHRLAHPPLLRLELEVCDTLHAGAYRTIWDCRRSVIASV